jgi:hypothetical protein
VKKFIAIMLLTVAVGAWPVYSYVTSYVEAKRDFDAAMRDREALRFK